MMKVQMNIEFIPNFRNHYFYNYMKKNDIINYCRKIVDKNLVKGSWGNISFLKENNIYITPSGKAYELLKPKDISVIDLNSNELVDGLKPSSELKLHKKIYNQNKDINSIIHTHSDYLSMISVLKEEIPPLTEDQVMIIGKKIPVANYYEAGSEKLAENVGKYFNNFRGVIMANHGYIAGGRKLQEAFYNALIAEKSAKIYINIRNELTSEMYIPEKSVNKLINKYKSYSDYDKEE